MVRPVIVALVVALAVFAIAVTHVGAANVDRSILYPVICEPPVLTGALHVKASCVELPVAEIAVGASGVVLGVTVKPALAALVPNALEAVTVRVYSRPFVNSPMVQLNAPVLHEHVLLGSVGVPDATAVAV